MPALEILQLQLAPGFPPDHPSILESFVKVRSALREKVHNTRSRCYQCIEDPTFIFIFGMWPDIATHTDFTNSPLRPEILALQGNFLEFRWMIHIEVEHINELPFNAPVLSVSRLQLSGWHVMEYKQVEVGVKALISEGTKPYNVIHSWRIDPEPGTQEMVTITGWESAGAEIAFHKNTAQANKDFANMWGYGGDNVTMHFKNMELGPTISNGVGTDHQYSNGVGTDHQLSNGVGTDHQLSNGVGTDHQFSNGIGSDASTSS